MPSSSYYNVDDILAEEELIPCTNLFDFSHLSHLQPDIVDKSYLPEGSSVKVPLWAMQQWALLGFVRMTLPRHFGRKARERLLADPAQADLRKRNERFFHSGRLVVQLMEGCALNTAASTTPGRRNNARRHAQQLQQDASDLKTTLLQTYTGERLRRTLDWAWSMTGTGEEDASHFLQKLTEMERRLFQQGAFGSKARQTLKTYGNRRISHIFLSHQAVVTPVPMTHGGTPADRPLKRAKL